MHEVKNCIFADLKKKIFSLLLILTGCFSVSLYAQTLYWENPAPVTNLESRFPVTVNNQNDSYIFWEEIDEKNKNIYLSNRHYKSLTEYEDNLRFAGPFSYSGEIPDIYSVAVNSNGNIAVAVMSDMAQISVYSSTDNCKSFEVSKLTTSAIMVAPRIYSCSDGTFKLFTSVGESESFTIFSADSPDGKNWSKFSQFQPAASYRNPFIPYLVATDSGDMVVFQAQYTSAETNRLSYQIYMTYNDGKNWSNPILVTGRSSLTAKDRKEFHSYQNQRPSLFNFDGKIYLAWERTDSVNSSIWIQNVTAEGTVANSVESVASSGNASRPILFTYKGSLYMTWFDTRRGRESIYMVKKNGSYWEETSLVENKNTNMFSYPLVTFDNQMDKVLSFVWQQTNTKNKNNISILSPDKSCNPPDYKPLSFKKGKRSKEQNVQIQIVFPSDSSNIAGYSYTWSKDEPEIPPKEIHHFTKENKVKTKATEDGVYYLSSRVVDYAGNWSEPSSISYYLDLTPPQSPEIDIQNVDKYGFINSNSFRLRWKNSVSDDVEGYVYRLDYLGDIPKNIAVSKNHPMKLSQEKVEDIKNSLERKYEVSAGKPRKMGSKIQTSGLSTVEYTKGNGVYVFSVAAVDQVGNVGEASYKIIILNKYQPFTKISSVDTSKNDMGDTILAITGQGFTYDGTIKEIYIDKDGKAPYDLTLTSEEGKFKVQSNTKITNVNIGVDLDEGTYKVGLLHTDRGLYFTGNILKIEQNGTIKIESDYVPEYKLNSNFREYKYKVAVSLIILFLILLFLCITVIFMLTGVVQNVKEKSIISGALMSGKKKSVENKHLPSLKRKLIRFTYSLIVIAVLAVTLQNGYKAIRLQEQTMAAGLENRTEVLLESLFSGVKNFFPANNILELTALPSQKDAMDEVKYVTIIGQKMDSTSSENINYVWATNDPDITSKITSEQLNYGESEIEDDTIREVSSTLSSLDDFIKDDLEELSTKIDELTQQASALYNTGLKDDEQEADRISEIVVDLRNQVDSKLMEYSKSASGSYPYFDLNNLDRTNTDYVFYRPVLYRKGTTGNYVHGVVYLELSTETLIQSLNDQIRYIVVFGCIVAVVAVLLGVFGSVIFASLIVRPIKKLESHVIMIGQTKNKALLKGKDVTIKSKDEVGRLGDAINNMTHELVANAEEEALAMDGKAVQKAFLPLASSGLNNKNTYSEYEDGKIQCFGYYEGESGVSGDYFDYKKLDDEWYGIIKCDASGHGIPAAIIMTVVATIFRRYFQNWSYKKNGTQLNVLVEQINDFIEGLGLRGKFATLIICLLNVKNGDLYMCNAGDNLVHIFEESTHSIKVLTLASAPTAGVFTSDLVAMRGGFVVEKAKLNKGDTLFLYTDGIEESTRRIREADYSVRQNDVEVKKMNPKTHQEEVEIKTEDAKEEFGPERVQEIIESVYNKKKFVLTKEDNPNTAEILEFDFTKCEGTVQEAILALASLEKVFRLYKSPAVQQTDYIKIDKKIDEFLSKYFNMYDYYAVNKSDNAENSVNYIDYDQMLEDEQSDDLTLLAIKRL